MPWKFYGPSGTKVAPVEVTEEDAGDILMYAGSYAPDGYFMCNGATIDISANPEYLNLYNSLTNGGTVGLYGAFTATIATIPDFRDLFPLGADSGVAVGASGGSNTSHNHTISSHQHQVGNHNHSIPNDHGGGAGNGHRHIVNHSHTVQNHTHTSGTLQGAGPPYESYVSHNAAGTAIATAAHGHNITTGSSGSTSTTGGASLAPAVANTSYSTVNQTSGDPGTDNANVDMSAADNTSTVVRDQPYLALNFIIKW